MGGTWVGCSNMLNVIQGSFSHPYWCLNPIHSAFDTRENPCRKFTNRMPKKKHKFTTSCNLCQHKFLTHLNVLNTRIYNTWFNTSTYFILFLVNTFYHLNHHFPTIFTHYHTLSLTLPTFFLHPTSFLLHLSFILISHSLSFSNLPRYKTVH